MPISIADINDNDNFHQLCFSTSNDIVKISMMANTVEDPNQDSNLYSEIDVVSCTPLTSIDDFFEEKKRLINVVDFLGRQSRELKNQPLSTSMMMELLRRKFFLIDKYPLIKVGQKSIFFLFFSDLP